MPAPVASSDPTFLQDQVIRLSAELARAQGKPASPDGSPPASAGKGAAHRPQRLAEESDGI